MQTRTPLFGTARLDAPGYLGSTLGPRRRRLASENMTPLLLAVHDAPVPFTGSDGCIHLAYELWITNFSSAEVRLDKAEIFGDGAVIDQLELRRHRATPSTCRPAQIGRHSGGRYAGSVICGLILKSGSRAPAQLSHRVTEYVDAAPPGHQHHSRKRRYRGRCSQ